MESKSSTLEVKVLNCKDLKPTNFNFFQKLNVFVTVALASDDPDRRPKSQHQKTTTEEEKDGNLDWNREMSFDLDGIRLSDCEHLFLTFAFYSPGNILFDDNLLGDVRVPLKDLVEEWNGVARFTSYEVRTIDGKPNGVLHFSYRLDFNGKEMCGGGGGGAAAGFEHVLRIDGYTAVTDSHYYRHENHNAMPLSKIEYPAIDGGGYGYGLQQQVGYTRPAEVIHTAHNGLPVSGVVHVSHEGMLLPGQPQNGGFYPPPPNPHMYTLGPPPPALPPHMMHHHQPHSPSSPHMMHHSQPHSPSSPHIGGPFHSHHYPPPPPPPVNPWGYDHGSSHGGGEHNRDRGLANYYPNY